MDHWERVDEIIDRAEQRLLVILLSLMILIAFFQIVLRNLFDTGLAWGDPLVRNLVLWVGFIGAALATKEGKHINIDVVSRWMPPRGKIFIEAITDLFSSFHLRLIDLCCCEIHQETRFRWETSPSWGIPSWIPEIILPITFGLMTLRFGFRSLKNFSMTVRMDTTDQKERKMISLLLIILILFFLFLGAPIFVVVSGLALYLLFSGQIDSSAMIIEMHRMATTPVLVAIPLFTFAGYLLSESGATKRLVRLSDAILGWLPGGLSIIALITCATFTALTGATGLTIIALGGILFPAMLRSRYPEKFSLGLLTTSGTLGLLFPPSLPLIIYAIVAKVGIDQLFLAGILPGILLVVLLSGFSIQKAISAEVPRTKFSGSEVLKSIEGSDLGASSSHCCVGWDLQRILCRQ